MIDISSFKQRGHAASGAEISTINWPRVLTCAEVAALLDATPARVYELARRGLIPCVRLGRSVRFLEEKILEWLENGGARNPGDGQ